MKHALRTSICLIPLLALAACGQARAGTVDPTDDFDCVIVSAYFNEAAKVAGVPAHEQWAAHVVSSWFTVTVYKEDPNLLANPGDRAKALMDAIGKDPRSYTDAMKACTARATADPRFNRFVAMLRKNKA